MKTKKTKTNKFKTIMNAIFNNPKVIFIVLIAIIGFLLIFLNKLSKSNEISIGNITTDELTVENIHYFLNNDMNYFFAAYAKYESDNDPEVYKFTIGYYVVDSDNNYIEFVSRNHEVEEPVKLSTAILENSAWNFGELSKSNYSFSKKVLKNIKNLHFVVRAYTDADLSEPDINIDEEVTLTKITR